MPTISDWQNLTSIGAIKRTTTYKGNTSVTWHSYISSRNLSAEELLHHARLEWSVESMHRLLDVHYDEDFCRTEDKNVKQNLNMIRKIALNSIRHYKALTSSKKPMSNIMFDCLMNQSLILDVLQAQ